MAENRLELHADSLLAIVGANSIAADLADLTQSDVEKALVGMTGPEGIRFKRAREVLSGLSHDLSQSVAVAEPKEQALEEPAAGMP